MRIRRVLMVGMIVGATLGMGSSPARADHCSAPSDSPAGVAICTVLNTVAHGDGQEGLEKRICRYWPDHPWCSDTP